MKKQFVPQIGCPRLLLNVSASAACLTCAAPVELNGRHIQSQQDLSPCFLVKSIRYPSLVENLQRFLACADLKT